MLKTVFPGLVIAAISLSSCGTGVKQVAAGPRFQPNGQQGCPNTNTDDVYEIDVTFPSGVAIPTKVAIDIDGVEKINECHAPTNSYPPLLKMQRVTPALLVLGADYTQRSALPITVSLKVVDLQDCGATQKVVGDFPNLPLNFLSASYGQACPTHQAAKESVTIPAPAKSPSRR